MSKNNELNIYTKERQLPQKIEQQYRMTRNNDILNEIPKHLTMMGKQGQLDTEGNYTTHFDTKQSMTLTLFKKPSGVDFLNNLNEEELKENLDKVFNSTNQQTAKLLDIFIIKVVENGSNSPTAVLDFKEYARILNGGLEPSKRQIDHAREKIRKGIDTLKQIGYTYKKGNNSQLNISLYGGTDAIDRGKAYFKFNDDFFRLNFYLKNSSYLAMLPIKLLSLNEKKYPNAYLIGKKLWSLRRINRGKTNRETKISIKTLYEYVLTLPRADKTNVRRATIIEPFERDLDAIADTGILKWNYIGDYADKITKGQATTFEDWLKASLEVEWCDEFNQLDAKIIDGKKEHKKLDKKSGK